MRCSMKFAFIAILFVAFSTLYAAKSEKIYFDSSSVSLHESQIYVKFEQTWVPVKRLSADTKGYYVFYNENEEDESDLPFGFWKCSNGHVNPPWKFVCWCGAA